MKEYKCYKCNFVLYRGEGEALETEVICPKCHFINYPNEKNVGFGLRGQGFHSKCIVHYCYNCPRFLLKSIGIGKIEVTCIFCSEPNIYDTKLMREGKYVIPPSKTPMFKKIKEGIAT